MRFWLTEAVLLLLLCLAWRRGGQPERWVAISLALTFFLLLGARGLTGSPQFTTLDPVLFTIDTSALALLVWVALRANRWWPLWCSALQLIVVVGHLAKLLEIKGMPGVYWGMTTLPIYGEYLLLLFGIAAHVRRRQKLGSYPDWRED